MMDTLELALGCLSLEILCLALAFSSYCLSGLLLGRVDLFARLCSLIVISLWIAAIGFHALMALNLFSVAYALPVALSFTALVFIFCRRRAPLPHLLRSDLRALARWARLVPKSPYRSRIYLLAVFSIPLIIRSAHMLIVSHDSLVYHATKAGLWIQTNNLAAMPAAAPGQWAMYGLFSGGSEIFLAWAMLPSRSDFLVPFIESLYWLGLAFSVLALCREIGAKEPFGTIAAGFVMNIPTIRLLIGSGYVEPLLNLSFVCGLLFGLRFIKQNKGVFLVLSLAALGISASTKLVALIISLVLAGALLFYLLLAMKNRLRNVAYLSIGVLCLLGVTAPWIAMSTQLTGYPLSPFPIEVAGLTLGQNDAMEWFVTHSKYPEPYVWENEWSYLKQVFDLPGHGTEALGLLTLLPLLLCPLGLAFLFKDKKRIAPWIFLALGTAIWTVYNPQNSQMRLTWGTSSSRFFLPALCVAVPLSILWCKNLPRLGHLYSKALWACTVFHAIAFTFVGWTRGELQFVLLSFFVASLLCLICRQLYRRRWYRAAGFATLAALFFSLFSLGLYKRSARYEIARNTAVLHPTQKYWIEAAQETDRVGRPLSVALTSGPSLPCIWYAYYFLGSAFQNEMEYVSPLPEGIWPAFCPGDGWEQRADFDSWKRRLSAKRIQYVMSFMPPSIELGWMEARPQMFERRAGSAKRWGLFRVKGVRR